MAQLIIWISLLDKVTMSFTSVGLLNDGQVIALSSRSESPHHCAASHGIRKQRTHGQHAPPHAGCNRMHVLNRSLPRAHRACAIDPTWRTSFPPHNTHQGHCWCAITCSRALLSVFNIPCKEVHRTHPLVLK